MFRLPTAILTVSLASANAAGAAPLAPLALRAPAPSMVEQITYRHHVVRHHVVHRHDRPVVAHGYRRNDDSDYDPGTIIPGGDWSAAW